MDALDHVQHWSCCFLGWRNGAKNVNSQRSLSTACVYFSTAFSCFSFLPADLIMLLCPHLLNTFSCCFNAYMLQPTTAQWPRHLPDPHPLVCLGGLPPTCGWSLEPLTFPSVIPWLRWVLHTHVSDHRPQQCFLVVAPVLMPLMNSVAGLAAWHFSTAPFNTSPDLGLVPSSLWERGRSLQQLCKTKWSERFAEDCKGLWEETTRPRIWPASSFTTHKLQWQRGRKKQKVGKASSKGKMAVKILADC